MVTEFNKEVMEAANFKFKSRGRNISGGDMINKARSHPVRVRLKGSDEGIMCNICVDGAWKIVRGKGYAMATIGCVVDHQGNILNEGGIRVHALNPCQNGAKAILKGLECVKQLHMQNVRVITHCM